MVWDFPCYIIFPFRRLSLYGDLCDAALWFFVRRCLVMPACFRCAVRPLCFTRRYFVYCMGPIIVFTTCCLFKTWTSQCFGDGDKDARIRTPMTRHWRSSRCSIPPTDLPQPPVSRWRGEPRVATTHTAWCMVTRSLSGPTCWHQADDRRTDRNTSNFEVKFPGHRSVLFLVYHQAALWVGAVEQ